MDQILRDQILVIAHDVRLWTEQKAIRSDYHPNDLMGWCAIASAELFKRLTAKGIKAEIHMHDYSYCHCFCVVDDYVVDVTATQFYEYRNETIVFKHVKEAEVHEYYVTSKVFKCANDLRECQLREAWPSKQIAFV